MKVSLPLSTLAVCLGCAAGSALAQGASVTTRPEMPSPMTCTRSWSVIATWTGRQDTDPVPIMGRAW